MEWKFWRRNKTDIPGPGAHGAKLPGPKELPQAIGQYLVTTGKQDPDWIWSLRCVVRLREGNKSVVDFRVFSPVQAGTRGVRITHFLSLDDLPELILFQGVLDKASNQVKLHKGAPDLAA